MPRPIRNRGAYLDRTWQEAHRREAGQLAAACDIDLMGYCGICRQPLYLTEGTMTSSRDLRHLQQLATAVDGEALQVVIGRADRKTEDRIAALQEQQALISAELEALTFRRPLSGRLLDGSGFELGNREQLYLHLQHIRERHHQKEHGRKYV